MLRASRKTQAKAGYVLLLVTLLVALYLYKYSNDPKTINLQEVKRNGGQTKAATRNNSFVYSWPACQKNLSATNSSDFSQFTVTFQDFLYYKHCRHFPLLLDVPDKCGGANESADVFLLLVIKSSPSNYDRREVLRKTWAEERLSNGVQIRTIFIVGTMDAGWEGERFNKLLEVEHREYNDILQWDFKDSFYNLTLKQILFLDWLDRNCHRARFIFNGDDDVFANTNNMVDYLQGLKDNNGSKHLFIGHLMVGSPLIREFRSRYFVSVELYNSTIYPPYCSGGGYIMSAHTALIIYNMSKSINLIPIDDAFMGMCLDKAGLSPAGHMGVEPGEWSIPKGKIDKYDPCYNKEKLLVHRIFSGNMYLMWKKVNDPNLKCHTKMHKKKTVIFSW